MARLSSLSPSQSVSFRHGTNVEFNSPNFNQATNGPLDPNVPPMEGYNLQAVSNKSRDFSNPMYDAVQSGTNVDPTLGNGSGELNKNSISLNINSLSRISPNKNTFLSHMRRYLRSTNRGIKGWKNIGFRQ